MFCFLWKNHVREEQHHALVLVTPWGWGSRGLRVVQHPPLDTFTLQISTFTSRCLELQSQNFHF